MKRKIFDLLLNWKSEKNRKPLILSGARQVGKTYILEKFGLSNFEKLIYINLEIEKNIREFIKEELSPHKIIQFIETVKQEEIEAEKTLIFFDEIQASEAALLSLKYFYEQTPEYYVVAAGSLLGVTINRDKYSFPVGKVTELQLMPLDFEEFLWALSYEKLSKQIKSHFENNQYIPEAVHNLALELYDKYLIIGGMPEAVKTYISTNSFIKVQQIQNEIVNQYLADMAKYANATTSVKIRASYNSIPVQLAKENAKFQYKIVQKGASAAIFGESIEWLNLSNIILTCQKIQHAYIPINAYVDLSSFKLYMSDIGILTMKSNFPIQIILSPINHDNTFLGAITENYVAQSLKANNHNLFYWTSEAKAEVDFILQIDDKAIPIEVKKGKRNRSKSLSLFMKKYDSNYAIRISRKNFGFENNIKSIPLYAVFCI